MTGFGQAQAQDAVGSCAVEVRAVNNKFFKLHLRLPDSHAGLEGALERLVREHVRRGSVTVSARIDRGSATPPLRINAPLLRTLLGQVREAVGDVRDGAAVAGLLALPGVVEQSAGAADPD